MKCNVLVKWIEKGKKKKLVPNFWMREEQYQETEKWVKNCFDNKVKNPRPNFPKREELITCNGNIIADVSTSIDGGCGCCGYALLEINYKCNKCGFTYYPDLPKNAKDLSEFVTEKL